MIWIPILLTACAPEEPRYDLEVSGPVSCRLDRREGQVVCQGGEWGAPVTIPFGGATALGLSEQMSSVTSVCAVVDGGIRCVDEGTLDVETIPGISEAVKVRYPCAILDSGEVSCFRDAMWALPADLTDVVDLRFGVNVGYALHGDGTVTSWGEDVAGALGDDPSVGGAVERAAVSGIDDAVAIASRVRGGCALREDGRVSCWGWGTHGENGDGEEEDRAEPVDVVGIEAADAIGDGLTHSCAIERGAVNCWGIIASEGPSSAVPVQVEGIDDAVEVAGGWYHACAMRRNGDMFCLDPSGGFIEADGF